MKLREIYTRELRRAIEADDLKSAEEIATKLSHLIGEPRENDHAPEPIPCWGVEV